MSRDTTSVSPSSAVSNTHIVKKRNRKSAPSLTDKMSAALNIILQPEPESDLPGSSSVSVITGSMKKLQEGYKNKDGWTMEDLQLAYEILENPVKAEVFLALISPEDQELRLRR